jgi:hypothetical protein
MRVVFLYFFLIGAPVLGILGLLRMGRDLTPPVSIKGAWTVKLDPQPPGDQACEESRLFDDTTLTISQSGSHLLLKFNDKKGTALDGQIGDSNVMAEGRHHSAAGADEQGGTAAISMRATLERQTGPGSLRGELILNGCAPGVRVPFTATRK